MRLLWRGVMVRVVCVVCLFGCMVVAPARAVAEEVSASGLVAAGPLAPLGSAGGGLGLLSSTGEVGRVGPEAFWARQTSSTQYEGVSGAASRRLVGALFPGLIDRPVGGPPQLPAGVRATGFPSDRAMSVLLPGSKHGKHAVIMSSSPIAVGGARGRRRPLDLRLRASGSGFRAVDPLVGVRFSKRLSDGAALEGSGISLTPVTAAGVSLGGAEGVLDGASVFYGDSEDPRAGVLDMDTLAKPSPAGLMLESVLRSERSPRKLFFRVGMPRGARLSQAKDGSVAVRSANGTLAMVSVLQGAQDAEGVPVPVSIGVSGDMVVLTVPHPAGRYRMPVVVDPTVTDTKNCASTDSGTKWAYVFSGAFWEGRSRCPGEYLVDEAGSPEENNGFGSWIYPAQGESHIYGFISETSSTGVKVKNELAIVNSSKVAEASASYPASYSTTRTELCAEAGCAPGLVMGTNEANIAAFETIGVGKYEGTAKAVLTNALLELLQEKAPAPVLFNETSPTVHGETNALYTHGWLGPESKSAIEVTAADPGLGVNEWSLSSPLSSEWHAQKGTEPAAGPCVVCSEWGIPTAPAYALIKKAGTEVNYSGNFSVFPNLNQLPDGEDTVEFTALDAVGLSTKISTKFKVDSTSPYDLLLTGLPPNKEIGNGIYHLKGTAKDGSGSTPSSGIGSLVIKVDGKQVGPPLGSCTPGPCTASGEWAISGSEFGVGQHELTLTATDNAGNVATEKFVMFVARPTTPLPAGPGSVDPQSGELHLQASDVAMAVPGGRLTVGRSYGSLHLTAGSEGPLGPQWSLSVDSAENLTKLPDGDMLLTTGTGLQAVYVSKGGGEFTPAKGDSGLTLTEKTVEGKAEFLLKDGKGDVTTFTASSAGGGTVWLPTLREGPSGSNTTMISYKIVGSIVDPLEMIAPKPAGVSSCSPELVKGCRALKFVYATKTTATGNSQSEWGEYNGRLQEITYTAWKTSAAKMVTVGVAKYLYDNTGRLRAEWDLLISPALETTYGYDSEGHVTTLTSPGQQPWYFTYGSIVEDQRPGRLLAVARPNASRAFGNGVAPVNTTRPSISGTATIGSTLTVSKGSWENAPLAYTYRWESCNTSGLECAPINGQTNPKLVVGNSMVGHELTATVTATDSNGSTANTATPTAVVNAPEWYYDYYDEIGECTPQERGSCEGEAGLAVDSEGNIWAADHTKNQLDEFSPTGKLIASYGSKGSGNGQFNGPSGVAIDPATGNVYVVDSGNNRVEWFSSVGKYEGQFGKAGIGNNEYKNPTGIAIADGDVFTVDAGNNRVQIVELSNHLYAGKFGKAGSGTNGEFSNPKGIAVIEYERNYYAYVVDGGNNRVEEWGSFGGWHLEKEKGTFGSGSEQFKAPTGIAYDATKKKFYVGDTSNNRFVFFERGLVGWGTLGSEGSGYFGQMRKPKWVATRPGESNSTPGPYVSDAGNNRLMQASTGSLGEPPPLAAEPPSATSGSSITTFEYHLPASGVSAPYELGAKEAEAWAQSDDPTEATAVFPPDEPMGWPAKDYQHATIYYMDGKGRTVNVAAPGGGISTTEYNETNNLTRSLSADNRATALKEGSKSAEVAKLLDTQSTYTTEGNELTSTLGPRHLTRLGNGKEVQAREHTVDSYDEGAPVEGGPYGLVTKTTQGAQIEGEAEQDLRTATNTYSGQENLGWKLRRPTLITADPSGLKLGHTTVYEAATENVTETRMPKSTGSESAHNTKTVYYTTAANSSYPSCGEHAEWAGLVCETLPAKQPGTSGLPNLPVTTITYNMYDEPVTMTSTVSSNTRTTKIEYDEAGRIISRETTSTVGKTLPKVSYKYSETTGMLVEQTAGTQSVKSVYNSLGQLTSYTDASGNTSKYEYEKEGDERLMKLNDGLGSQTYGYDPTTGALTEVVDSAAGTFKATYDIEGRLLSVSYPNAMKAEYTYNEAGETIGLKYVKTAHCASTCPETWYSDTVVPSIHGQWLTQTSSLATDIYAYDAAGRLTETKTTQTGKGCVTRKYAYDADTNRTILTTYQPNSKGECATETSTVEKHTYDEADRLTDTGVKYEPFGGTEKLSAADAGGSELLSSFYVDGQSATLEQGGETIGHYLDPEERIGEVVATGKLAATETYHYTGPGGSTPVWTSEPSGHTTRNITGINGLDAIQYGIETPVLQLTNLHGDVIATVQDNETVTSLTSTITEGTEYGVPATEAPPKYSWLGGHEIPTEMPSGISTMGVRSYVPELGRFLQPDPMPGGSANAYAYTYGDPINTNDLTGESAIIPAWYREYAAAKAQQVAEEEAIREAAAREAAARAEAERKAAEEAAWAAEYSAMNSAYSEGEEGWGEEEWWEWEEEEGGYEYISDNHDNTGNEGAHAELALLDQSLISEGESGSEGVGAPDSLMLLCKAGPEGSCARGVGGFAPHPGRTAHSRHHGSWGPIGKFVKGIWHEFEKKVSELCPPFQMRVDGVCLEPSIELDKRKTE
jgi:RHS repeat-associated protein